MTEEEWLACGDPKAILALVCEQAASERQLRLFAVACCRIYWHLFRKKSLRSVRQLVLTAERYAEGTATEEELVDVASSVKRPKTGDDAGLVVKLAFSAAITSDPHVGFGERAAAEEAAASASAWAAESGLIVDEVQVALLRDIFKFTPPPPVLPEWLAWRDGIVSIAAHEAYRSRDFSAMPVMADMLVDAGCTDADLLSHLRSPGPHVRGCWVLDLLLGKE